MSGILSLFILVILLTLLTWIPLHRGKGMMHLYAFDRDTTLPLRGLLSLLIIGHHVSLRYPDASIGVLTSYGNPLVAIFFFCSGYGLLVSYRRKGAAYLSDFFRHRFSRLLPVFLLLTLGCAAVQCLTESLSPLEVLRRLVLRGTTPLPNSWFIYTLLYLYVVFYVACKTTRTTRSCLLVAALLTAVAIGVKAKAGYGCWHWCTMPSFLLGMGVAAEEERIRRLLCRRPTLLLLPLVVAMLAALGAVYLSGDVEVSHHRLSTTLYANAIPLLLLCYVYLWGFPSHRLGRYLGRTSLEIYLLHGIFLAALDAYALSWEVKALITFGLTLPAAGLAHVFSSWCSEKTERIFGN
jgi:peptidoglycan/LPS O-acetylase OafA/YrhL